MDSELLTPSLHVSAEPYYSSAPTARPIGTLAVLLTSDAISITSAILIASFIRDLLVGNHLALPSIRIFLATIVLTICCFVTANLYPGVAENPVEELRRCWLACTLAFLSLAALTFLSQDMLQSRLMFLLAGIWCLILVPLARAAARVIFAEQTWWGSPVAILGSGKTGKLLLDTLKKNPAIGLKPVAVLDDNPAQYSDVPDHLIVGPISRCLEIAREHRISYAIVCMPGLSRKDLLHLMDAYGHCFRHVMVIPDLIGMASLGLSVREIGGIIGLEVAQNLLRPSARMAKRTLDLLITLLIGPVLLLVVAFFAVLVKLESPGSAFYANERIGYRGRKFKAWKLRSMVVNGDDVLRQHLEAHPEDRAHWNATQKLKKDPRVTRIGAIIRKTSIDELPQLWNVLIGEMSVVGPRPFLENQIEIYGPAYALYQRVRPGITGLWQISGRNELSFKERVRMDVYTIQNWSVWLDIYILARTVLVVLTAKGAY